MQDSPSPTTQTPHAPVQYTKISASFGELRGPEVGRPSKAHSGLIGSHAAFNPRYMEHGHGSNPKQKRKGSSSPTKEPISKKKPGKTTEKKLNEIQSAYQHRQRQPTWRHCQGYQAKSWAKLCRAVDDDPWGLPYGVVTKKIIRKRSDIETRGRGDPIANHLFPAAPSVPNSK
ncbi:hypothetical protein QTP88_027216 [Uroleucon formosanum]